MPPVLYPPIPSISFSKNPIWLKLQSDDFRNNVPAAAVNYLDFTGAIAADTAIILSWTGGSVTLTAKAAPNLSGIQFPTGAGDAAYVTLALPYFKGNYFLDKYYTITQAFVGGNPRIVFTAKPNGPEYNFTPIGNIGVVTAGVTDAPKTNFRHHVQLWMADPTGINFTQVYTANVPLDHPSAGLTSIDIHEALHASLTSDNPELLLAMAQCKNSVRRCYVKYAQFFGTDPAVMLLYQSDDFYVTKGGLGKEAIITRNLYDDLCPNPLDRSTWRFLRQGSKTKMVRMNQPEWLTWLNLTNDDQTVKLEVIIVNDDGTQTTFYPSGTVIHGYEKWQFQVGFSQINITGQQPFGTRPIYYTARLSGNAGYLTTAYTYVIDYNYEEWARFFVFENSYGAFQTICTTGKGQKEFDRDKQDARYAVDQLTAAIAGEFLETNITIQDKFTVNYGYNRAGARNITLLRDFFRSDKKFVYENGRLKPIGISTKNMKDAPDGTTLYASSFEYFLENVDEVYTEDPAQADDNKDELLIDAGSAPLPLPPAEPGTLEGYNLRVISTDPRLSIVAGKQRYTNNTWLIAKTGYTIYSTQMNAYFRLEDVTYNAAGYFDIQIPGFRLQAGEQLIVCPFLLINP